ncbi:MAG: YggS family pyridoxal phosphate-dependent enzyme [Myxococcota bacterium]
MSVVERLDAVRERLANACHQAGRDPADVQLIAVSKTHPAAAIEAAKASGQLHFGENYAQELRDKCRVLPQPDLRWHYIGRLQSNKAKYVAPVAYRVHALETVSHAKALAAKAPGPLSCLVSVNLGLEDSKAGVPPDQALDRCAELAEVPGIRIVGLMALPPYDADPAKSAPHFETLANLAAHGRSHGLPLNELSMGMSHDFEVAVQYGATWIRVGTAIFGPRPKA